MISIQVELKDEQTDLSCYESATRTWVPALWEVVADDVASVP